MKRLFGGFIFSSLLHAVLFGAAFGWIAWDQAHAERSIDIDLSGSSLLMRPKNAVSPPRPVAPPQPWVLALKGQVSRPQAQAVTQSAQPDDTAGAPCPAPCPENAGDWLPVAAASRRPEWSEGMLSPEDFPVDLKRKGVEGKVVVEVLIDASGNVRGVTLQQGSEPGFNELVLERLKRSKFRPAYDQNGNAVACRLRLPLVFRLED